MTWDGCVTCGQSTKHANWCGWVNEAIREARVGEQVKEWWPWWLEPTLHQYHITSENAREIGALGGAVRAMRRQNVLDGGESQA